jgi:hypothetical protein
MTKRLLIIIPIILFSKDNLININDNSFITQFEYGKMLYRNPRGISCKKCHGKKAQGKIISKFKHRIKMKTYNCLVKTTNITNVKLINFKDKLNPNKKLTKIKFVKNDICNKLIYGNTMPKYFLTQDELNSLYFYITNITNNE